MIIPLKAETENNDLLKKLPVAINIQRLSKGNVVLEISNATNQDYSLFSNLDRVLDYTFEGFPTLGSLQLNDVKSGLIPLHGQRANGWFYPEYLSSNIDIEKSNNIRSVNEIKIKANEVKIYPIKYDNVLKVAIVRSIDENNESVKDFRIRIPIDITIESGEKVSINVISKWFPVIH